MSVFFTLASVFVPGLPETYRRWIFYSCVALLLVSIVCWLLAHRTSPTGSNGRVDVRAGANQRGHIQAAGRDAIQTVHHHYQSDAEPLGMRIDASALRDLKKHRDRGERMLTDIKPGDGASGSRWGEINSWWDKAITKSNQNVFASFFNLVDLERLKEPWPEEDKLRIVAKAIDSAQIDNTDDDIRFYGTMWERLERLRQLIRVIESPRSDTKKLDIAVYDSFEDLVQQGEAMLKKFSNNERPLPTENEFQRWDKRLIAQAESCATIEERNKLRAGNPMPVSSDDIMSLYMIVGTELWPIAQKLVSKLRISHEIMARLRHESG